jgi:tripartite-type tricarboxylate transporter receptor subunit TctC
VSALIPKRRFLAAMAALTAAPLAFAQNSAAFPERPIRVLVGYAAGGGTDILARLIAQKLSESLGKPVFVENKPGASGMTATAELTRAPADGYTVLVQIVTPAVIGPLTQKNLPFDPVKDVQPVGLIAKLPNVMIINKDIPANSVKEFLAWVKARPGKISYGSGGAGGITHLEGELLNKMAGTDMVHVPYKGAAPAIMDLIAGRVHMVFDNVTGTSAHIKSGAVKALAVTTEQRVSALPDVPTFAEAGLPQFTHSSWISLFTRAGVPASVLAKLEAELLKVVNHPETVAKLRELGAVHAPMNAAGLDAFWKSEFDFWRKAITTTNFKID